jgi:hypothetical protein
VPLKVIFTESTENLFVYLRKIRVFDAEDTAAINPTIAPAKTCGFQAIAK